MLTDNNTTAAVPMSAQRPALVSHRSVALGVVGFALLTALAAKLQVPMFPVPMTLQTAAVLLAGIVLGPLAGAASQVLYLTMGLAGWPVFAGPAAGPLYLLGPTGGYLVGFVVGAFVAGCLAPRRDRGVGKLLLAALAGTVVILVLGVSWLAYVQQIGLRSAVAVGVVPFVPGAVVKVAMVVSAVRLLDLRRPVGK
jgi:biotin transport system substrate-specific component